MNRFLIAVLDVLNQLLALFLIAFGAISGATRTFNEYFPAAPPWSPIVGGLLGLVGGIIAAGLVCGLIAAIVTICRELTAIRIGITTEPPLYPPAGEIPDRPA